jgi:predicted nucleic acid-binding protein
VAVALDSAAVVAFLDGRDALHDAADDAIRKLMAGHRFYASVITFSEVLTGAHRSHHDESIVRGFFTDLVSEVLVVDRNCGERAARLRADHKSLRLPDAVVLAAADGHPDVEILLTGDAAMASVKGLDCRVELLRPPA